MEYRFDVLFRIELRYPGLEPMNRWMTIQPTSDCMMTLQRFGTLCRSTENGIFVAMEKMMPSGAPLRPIRETVSFRFLLKFIDPHLLDNTAGFESGAALLPYVGRSRFAYFSNLDDALVLDGRTELARAAAQVSQEDMGSLASQTHQFVPATGTSQVSLTPLTPGGGPATLRSVAAGRPLSLAVPDPNGWPSSQGLDAGAWHLQQVGSTLPRQLLVADDALLGSKSFGLIEIFKDATVDLTSPVLYTISFQPSP